MPKTDPQVTKRRVTMVNSIVSEEGDQVVTRTITAVDYVRPDFLAAYVADARTRWAVVAVSEEPDAGPAGYDGATYIPAHLDHPDAHTYYPATDCRKCDHAPDVEGLGKARVVRVEG